MPRQKRFDVRIRSRISIKTLDFVKFLTRTKKITLAQFVRDAIGEKIHREVRELIDEFRKFKDELQKELQILGKTSKEAGVDKRPTISSGFCFVFYLGNMLRLFQHGK